MRGNIYSQRRERRRLRQRWFESWSHEIEKNPFAYSSFVRSVLQFITTLDDARSTGHVLG